MRENDYTFPVLFDDGYRSKNHVSVFPVTWVTTEERRIAFEKEGYTENLVEGFSWRVESLRGSKTEVSSELPPSHLPLRLSFWPKGFLRSFGRSLLPGSIGPLLTRHYRDR